MANPKAELPTLQLQLRKQGWCVSEPQIPRVALINCLFHSHLACVVGKGLEGDLEALSVDLQGYDCGEYVLHKLHHLVVVPGRG